jgi:alkylated DNA repair dioxygenase AlkB
MSLLFNLDNDSLPQSIPGLNYVRDFVSAAAYERELVELIDESPWDTTWERRRQPYGQSYGRRERVPPLPSWGIELAEQTALAAGLSQPFEQMLVNEYLPGQGIALHRDYEPFDRVVASVSLLAPCVMDFRRIRDGRRESLLLEQRSLLVLSDESRYEWEHGIARRKKDRWNGTWISRARRISVTFRNLKSAGARGQSSQNRPDDAF